MFSEDPGARIEEVFRRIQEERMAGLPFINPALSVAAVGFARHGADWRGVLLTPWGIQLLLLPAVADWPVPPLLTRAFRQYPAGTFAFLPNHEKELGDYLACPLISDMHPFADQQTALATARACLIALDIPPVRSEAQPAAPASDGRRRFLGLDG
ncbi:[NiFe]-hydrogenase assembly chaperone HybE [Sulfuricystis multivorans]|uniref:[NiFe]-hydrogenase assembly chaperone HybE n=1 Tax=Sulfuricystis multivorans TaxID=2211108 RepID=UPI001558E99A|nr:[NiFe]-hydrogenase assembly chaperone HybE [Sulfuricystis multivorans]